MRQIFRLIGLVLGFLLLADSWPVRLPEAHAAGSPLFISALDLSGSTKGSDPDGYGISAIAMRGEALAPGRYMVMTFAGEPEAPDAIQKHGPYNLGDQAELQRFRDDIQSLYRGTREGNTPLADVVSRALATLKSDAAPAGSELTVFTDGVPAPDGDGQLDAIEKLAAEFSDNKWRLSFIMKGSPAEKWATRLGTAAKATGGFAKTIDNMPQLHGVLLQALNSLGAIKDPVQWGTNLPPSGAFKQIVTLDAAVREALFLVTRPSMDTKVKLQAPDGSWISSTDRRVLSWVDSDRHFVLIRLKSDQPLGAGNWSVVVEGDPNTGVSGASVYDNALSLQLEQPVAKQLVPAGRAFTFVASARSSGELITAVNASIQMEITGPGNQRRSLILLDDGGAGNTGDQFPGDGKYSANVQLDLTGEYSYTLRGKVLGVDVIPHTDTFLVDFGPSLASLGTPGTPGEIPEGETREIGVARLMVGNVAGDPGSITELTVRVVSPKNGDVGTVKLDPKKAFRDGVLYVPITPRRNDGEQQSDERGIVEETLYQVQVSMSGTYRSVPFNQEVAFKTQVRTVMRLKMGFGQRIQRWWQAMAGFLGQNAVAVVSAIVILAVLLATRAGLGRIRNPRKLFGVLVEVRKDGRTGRKFDLSRAMSMVSWFTRLFRVKLDLGVFDEGLDGIEVSVDDAGRMFVRARRNGLQGKINGALLTTGWHELRNGSRLVVGNRTLKFEMQLARQSRSRLL